MEIHLIYYDTFSEQGFCQFSEFKWDKQYMPAITDRQIQRKFQKVVIDLEAQGFPGTPHKGGKSTLFVKRLFIEWTENCFQFNPRTWTFLQCSHVIGDVIIKVN